MQWRRIFGKEQVVSKAKATKWVSRVALLVQGDDGGTYEVVLPDSAAQALMIVAQNYSETYGLETSKVEGVRFRPL